jgi:phosphate-selective porin OprO/OprP
MNARRGGIMIYKKHLLSALPYTFAALCLCCAPIAHAAQYSDDSDADRANIQSQLTELRIEINNLKEASDGLTQRENAIDRRDKEQQKAIVIEQKSLAIEREQMAVEVHLANQDTWYLKGHDAIPRFITNDGRNSFGITGQIQVDSGLGQVPGQEGFSGGTEFRKVQLSLLGVYEDHYIWKIEEDFSKTTTPLGGLDDAYIGYVNKFGNFGNIALVGNQFVPFGFQTASGNTPFMETELPADVWYGARQLGITDQMWTNKWNLWFGVQAPTPTKATPVFTGNSQTTFSGDFAYNFLNSPGRLISLRGSVMYNKFNDNPPTFETFPDIQVYGTSLINTGALNIQSDIIYSPRIDLEFGPFAFSASYYGVRSQNKPGITVSQGNPTTLSPHFSGWHVEAYYFLTNDTIPYGSRDGNYEAVVPSRPLNEGGIGAIQLLGRVDEANLNDARYGIHGGNESDITLGVNWYPVDPIRVMINYVKVLPISGAEGPNTFEGAAPSIVAARLQFRF